MWAQWGYVTPEENSWVRPRIKSTREQYRYLNSHNLDCIYGLRLRSPPSRHEQLRKHCSVLLGISAFYW
jgi:hypothetical protein